MNKTFKTKSRLLLPLLFCTLFQFSAAPGVKQSIPTILTYYNIRVNKNDHFINNLKSPPSANDIDKEDLLTVQNTDLSNKQKIKKQMQYIDKILAELDKILYSKEKASAEILQKIKRLLLELERLRKDREH